MQKRLLLVTFIAVQLFFVFFHIHKQSTLIRLSYDKQKNEKMKSELLGQKKQLEQELHVAHARSTIKQYASTKLALKQLRINQVKKNDI